jgi:phosphoribosylcarboxyaminoimidazole (NCAIR) mutase
VLVRGCVGAGVVVDAHTLQAAVDILKEFGVPHEVAIISVGCLADFHF